MGYSLCDPFISLTVLHPQAMGFGWQVWRGLLDLVKGLSEIMVGSLPGFWKIAKAHMEGRLQKVRDLYEVVCRHWKTPSCSLQRIKVHRLLAEVPANAAPWP